VKHEVTPAVIIEFPDTELIEAHVKEGNILTGDDESVVAAKNIDSDGTSIGEAISALFHLSFVACPVELDLVAEYSILIS